eukprot:352965-Chlamydomonas_euryale.AAC.13
MASPCVQAPVPKERPSSRKEHPMHSETSVAEVARHQRAQPAMQHGAATPAKFLPLGHQECVRVRQWQPVGHGIGRECEEVLVSQMHVANEEVVQGCAGPNN